MFHLLWEAIIGLIVGALAKFIMPGKDPGGIIITMLLGIAGALLAGWLGGVIGWYKEGQSAGFIASLVGAPKDFPWATRRFFSSFFLSGLLAPLPPCTV
jgi:uncharacterized membrane protein YeaQ/YmgE (transglycosylase-associated protein family)